MARSVDSTILRPGWFTSANEIAYETTPKDEPCRGYDLSRKSVASPVVRLATTPGLDVRKRLNVNKLI